MNDQKYPKSEGAVWLHQENPIAQIIGDFVHGLKQGGQLDASRLPHFKGRIIVTNDQIRKLIAMSKAGQEPQIQIGTWFRTPKSGGAPYMYQSTEVYMKEVEQQPQQGGYQSQQQPQQGVAPYQPPAQQQQPQQDQQPDPDNDWVDDDIPF